MDARRRYSCRMRAALLSLLLTAAPLAAQPQQPMGRDSGEKLPLPEGPQAFPGASPGLSSKPAPSADEADGGADADRDGGGAEADRSPVSIEDARVNFASIVETFVARQSPEGFWLLRDKKTGRARRLRLLSVNAKAVKDAGAGRFKGPAQLRDLGEGADLPAEFVVDMSGSDWKVVGLRLLPKTGTAASARKGRRPAAPAPAE